MFYIFLSKSNDQWYLSYNNKSCHHMCHMNHFQITDKLINHSYNDLSQDIKDYIQNSFANRVNGTVIIEIVSTIYNINITQHTLDRARTLYTDNILREYGLNPESSPCDKFLQFFVRTKTSLSLMLLIRRIRDL